MESIKLFNPIMEILYRVLPLSPFRPYINALAEFPYLSWINWFFPFSELVELMSAYTVAVGLYYTYVVLMRWVKVIGD